ncbi:MAG: hypothetical protein J3Q66DRAFT_441491 [Benniella sp.]|nr:MAG: hypothetical protein J3Q66DRAFT_441491 [Benniella sp.]
MSATSSQAVRSRSSSETILIPVRQDPRSGQHIVLWKDIQRCFENAKYIMCRREMIPFLTDDDFEDLTPLRILHRPGEVLEVVVTDVKQGDTSSAAVLGNNNMVSELSVAPSSRSGVASVTRDVASLRISEIGDDNQALIVHPQGHLSVGAIQMLPTQSASHHSQGADNMTLQEQLHQPQQQVQRIHREIQEIHGRIQQTGQQAQDTQQQMKDDVDTTLQQMDQRIQDSVQQLREQVEETCQTTQHWALGMQQHEEALRTVQQQSQQQIERWDQQTQGSRQQTQDKQQQVQRQLSEAIEKLQHMEQQLQHSQQQHQQLQQQILKMEKVCQQDHFFTESL